MLDSNCRDILADSTQRAMPLPAPSSWLGQASGAPARYDASPRCLDGGPWSQARTTQQGEKVSQVLGFVTNEYLQVPVVFLSPDTAKFLTLGAVEARGFNMT